MFAGSVESWIMGTCTSKLAFCCCCGCWVGAENGEIRKAQAGGVETICSDCQALELGITAEDFEDES